MNRPRLRDIAEELQVSIATVSRALRDAPDIGADLKRRVAEVGARIGYRRNQRAASLRSARTMRIGVLVPDFTSPFLAAALRGITEEAVRLGYEPDIRDSRDDQALENRYVQTLVQQGVDGLLVAPVPDSDGKALRAAQKDGVPLVVFDRTAKELDAHYAGYDNQAGGRLATLHLLDQGCKRIGLIEGPPNLSVCRERKQGYITALFDRGQGYEVGLIQSTEDFHPSSGRKAMNELLQRNRELDGVFVVSDMLALGAMHELYESRRIEKRYVALVGYDDMPIAEHFLVPLTTVRQDGEALGAEAAAMLARLIEEPSGIARPSRLVLPPALVNRRSTTAPVNGTKAKEMNSKQRVKV